MPCKISDKNVQESCAFIRDSNYLSERLTDHKIVNLQIDLNFATEIFSEAFDTNLAKTVNFVSFAKNSN